MTNTATVYKSPLHQMTQTTCTCLWNDSSSLAELGYAIDHGAVGATCNPVIVVEVLKKEMQFEREFVKAGGLLMTGVDPTGWGGVVAGYGDQRGVELVDVFCVEDAVQQVAKGVVGPRVDLRGRR